LSDEINATLGKKDWLLIDNKCFLTSIHVEHDMIVVLCALWIKGIDAQRCVELWINLRLIRY
jgi:hypothetical protein